MRRGPVCDGLSPPEGGRKGQPFGTNDYIGLTSCVGGRGRRKGFFFSRMSSGIGLARIVRGVSGGGHALGGGRRGFCSLSCGPSRERVERLIGLAANGIIGRLSRLDARREVLIFGRFQSCMQRYVRVCTGGFGQSQRLATGSLICFKEVRRFERFANFSRRIGLKLGGRKSVGPNLGLRTRIVISEVSIARAVSLSPHAGDQNGAGVLGNQRIGGKFGVSG